MRKAEPLFEVGGGCCGTHDEQEQVAFSRRAKETQNKIPKLIFDEGA